MNALLSRNSSAVCHGPDPLVGRKLRMRNATQAVAAVLTRVADLETVSVTMSDRAYAAYVRRALLDEIVPPIALAEETKRAYAAEVIEQLRRHSAIEEAMMLDPLTYWRSSVLPALVDYHGSRGTIPPALAFSLATLIALFRREPIATGETKRPPQPLGPSPAYSEAASLLADAWTDAEVNDDWYAFAYNTLRQDTLWGQDLSRIRGMVGTIAQHLATIATSGARAAVCSLETA